MDGTPIKVLAIEDNLFDARLIRDLLEHTPQARFELRHERRLADGLAALREVRFEVVLLDLMLEDSEGLDTVDRVQRAVPSTPIIVLTHVDDELNAVQAVRHGAQDYLFKTRLDGPLLSRSIAYALERKRAERELAQSMAEREMLERQVLSISTREQQRIGQDLHDSVGQQLTGLSFMASSLAKKLESRDLPEADDAKLISHGIQTALTEVRAAIRGLAPVEVDAAGLMVALGRLVSSMGEGIKSRCVFNCLAPVPVEDNDTATHLYRVAQEALHHGRRAL